jgi:pimeloyl-ACP methyl ester carboxylesterase
MKSLGAMPIKTVLITEPEHSLLRELAMQFLQKPDVRVVCLDEAQRDGGKHLLQLFAMQNGEIQFRNCEESPIDEIWHTENPADSIEEGREKTDRVLLVGRRNKGTVVYYLSFISAVRKESSTEATPWCSDDEQKRLLNEEAVKRSGCKFKIYSLPLSAEEFVHPASWWTQFGRRLSRFKNEIEDRLPGYFTAHPLRLFVREDGAIEVARIENIVRGLEETLRSGTKGSYSHIRTQRPLPVKECLDALGQSAGVRFRFITHWEQRNYVDRLFALRMGEPLAHLERAAQAATEGQQEEPSVDHVRLTVPSASLQDLVGKPVGVAEEVADWKSFFEQKQVLLPDGTVLHYYDGGQGEKTLVLLNAYGQSFGYWERFFRAACDRFHIILWLPRGNDGDTVGLKVASPQAIHAEDLEQVLSQEGVENCTLLAWCSGPKLALEYYSRHPHRVSSMLFVAGSFKGLPQHKLLETEYEKNLESLLEAIEKYPETAEVVLEYLKGALLGQGKQARSVEELATISDRDLQQALSGVNVSLQNLVLHPFHAANVVAYAKQMRDFWMHDFVAALNKITVPVVFVGGDCDRIASQAIAKLMAGMIPKAKYLEVKGGTHYIHYDQWNLLAQAAEQIVSLSSKLEFSAPGTELTEFEEFMTARQS